MSIGLKNNNENCAKKAYPHIPPAIQALVLQIVALSLCLLLSMLFRIVLIDSPPIIFFVFIQAALAAFLAFLRGMDWWWWIIQFSFPILIIIFLFIEIPSSYYLIGFVILALLYWSTFKTQVPYYPSKKSLLPAILGLFPSEKSINFVDIGSGLGGLLIQASKIRKESNFVGIEIAPLPWAISYLRGKCTQSRVQFKLGTYEKANFGDYDVVFAYLSPAVMPAVWVKAKAEMKPGSLFLSYEFIIPDVTPDLHINITANDPTLYVWRI